MAKVTIDQFRVYDIQSEATVKSKRWAKEALMGIACGQVLKDTGVEVHGSMVRSDIHGFMAIGFNRQPRTGFEPSVRRQRARAVTVAQVQ